MRARDASDPEEGQRYARLTCTDDRTLGCVLYGEMLLGRDREAALIAFEWACRAGQVDGCRRAAEHTDDAAKRTRYERRVHALSR